MGYRLVYNDTSTIFNIAPVTKQQSGANVTVGVDVAGSEGFYTWKGQDDYKQERLIYYQKLLRERGITDHEHLKLMTANLIVENGALSESVHGDGGCSVGIPQRNVCLYGYSAKSFLKKYPAWNDWKVQMEWMANHTKAAYEKYNGDIFRTVVSHNRPASAARGVDSCGISPCYYQRVKIAAKSLELL